MAIETYREIARYFGDKDPTSRVLMETILAKEEEYADELSDLSLTLAVVIRPRTCISVTKSPTTLRRAMASVVRDDGAGCVEYSVRERHRCGQPITCVTGCSTRAAAPDSSQLAALATIAIEKIVLAILRRIEECWQPCQEKADEGKQETYAYRLGHR
jgi:hypothetical protein